MGKFEKLVVLAVLLAAAIVLAISLNRGKEVQAGDPLSGAEHLLESESGMPASRAPSLQEPDPAAPATASEEPAPSLLLHAGSEPGLQPVERTEPTAAPAAPTLALEPVSDPSHTILVARDGLRPSFLDEYMMYTAAEGDTWESLAQRFYQDAAYARNLHLANEGLAELLPGKEVLVPVYDFVAADAPSPAGAASTDASAASALLARPTPASAGPDSAPARPLAEPVDLARDKAAEYVVQAGDTLSDISLAVFGTATRWQELLDANKDRLSKPEALRAGMKLRIPAGGKVPAVAKAPKKTEPKPKTAQADKSSSAPKKKKVL